MLQSQARELIFNVLKFLLNEALEGISIPLKSVELFLVKYGKKACDREKELIRDHLESERTTLSTFLFYGLGVP